MKHIFIVNPGAGARRGVGEFTEKVRAACREHRAECEIHVSTDIMTCGEFIQRQLNGGGALRFYACGGDGTVQQTLARIALHPNVELGCIPLGSGNDFLHGFTKRKAFSDISAQITGEAVNIDILRANDAYCLNILNVGLDCAVAYNVKRFAGLTILGANGRYNSAILYSLVHDYGIKLEITTDSGEELKGNYIIAAFANGSTYGSGYTVAPDASLTDGLMDMVLINMVSRLKIARLMSAFREGKHFEHPEFKELITFRRAKSVRMRLQKRGNICVDGEFFTAEEVNIEVLPGALPFVVPRGAKMLHQQ